LNSQHLGPHSTEWKGIAPTPEDLVRTIPLQNAQNTKTIN